MENICLWDDVSVSVDIDNINNSVSDVKGEKYYSPARFIELYSDTKIICEPIIKKLLFNTANKGTCNLQFLQSFIVPVGENINHPPFVWKILEPSLVISNFIYNTNAFYRILRNLERQELIVGKDINNLLDEGCRILSSIYKYMEHFVIRNINNNINMSLITKIIEVILGKSVFNIEKQESRLTINSLLNTLNEIDKYTGYGISQLMAMAIARGRVFYKNFQGPDHDKVLENDRTHQTHRYFDTQLAIDHRHHLIDRVRNSNEAGIGISMSIILDDTSESIIDLLWIQKLLVENRFLSANLVLNRAQVSVNFSSEMLIQILANPNFCELAKRIGREVIIHEVTFPLISFQPNLLDQPTLDLINGSDIVFVKGLNFFETFQLKEKDIYYAFIVSSQVSEILTGVNYGEAVFALVPSGQIGYIYNENHSKTVTLSKIACLINQ